MGILTALLEREVSGEGQWVKTSLLQAQNFMLDFQAARWLMEKDVAKQAGNDHPTSILTGCSRPPTVISTSPPPVGGSGSVASAWARPIWSTSPNMPPGLTARRTASSSTLISKLTGENERDLGEGIQCRRRALRPDLFDRPGVCGYASRASRHRAGRA